MLVQNTETVRKYIPNISSNYEFAKLSKALQNTEYRFIKPILGIEFYAELIDYSSGNTDYDNLLPYLQSPICNLMMYNNFDVLNIKITDIGIHRIETDKDKPIFLNEKIEAKKHFKNLGFNDLDNLLEFLEINKEKYPKYVAPANKYFVNTAKQFSDIYNINESRFLFTQLKTYLQLAEDFDVKPLIGSAFFEVLKKEILDNSLSEANRKLLPCIQKVAIFGTVKRGGIPAILLITDRHLASGSVPGNLYGGDFEAANKEFLTAELENVTDMCKAYSTECKNFMKEHIADYPVYAGSSAYDDGKTLCELYNEKATKSVML